jgi:hypothetical protein
MVVRPRRCRPAQYPQHDSVPYRPFPSSIFVVHHVIHDLGRPPRLLRSRAHISRVVDHTAGSDRSPGLPTCDQQSLPLLYVVRPPSLLVGNNTCSRSSSRRSFHRTYSICHAA